MCGRYTLKLRPAEMQEFFNLFREPEWTPKFNIAPTQTVIGIRQHEEGRTADPFRWGLLPFWSKSMSDGAKMINARSETVAEKPAFKTALKKRRVIVPASGFYEWQKLDAKTKQPWYIFPTQSMLFPFAGIWETWRSPQGEHIDTCSILTTGANDTMAEVHDRMPVILSHEGVETWLDRSIEDPEELLPLCEPCPDLWMERHKVGTPVGNVKNECAECINPL